MVLGRQAFWPGVVALLLVATFGCRKSTNFSERARAKQHPDSASPGDSSGRVLPRAAQTLSEADQQNKSIHYGGTLHVHLEAEPPHLNPLLDPHQVIARVVSGLVYQTLIDCRGDQYLPGLAESWELSPDGQRLSLKLRADARWHDDRALTSVDVQASVEPIIRSNTRIPVLRALLSDVAAVDVLPDRVVRFRLHRPSRVVLRALCEVPILPAELLRGGTVSLATLGRQPLGTGPFKFMAWERGKRIRLQRVAPRGANGPYLDEVVFEIETDGTRALARTRQGDIDILPHVLEVHYPDQVAPGTLRETLQLYRLTPERYSFMVLNHAREPLADARFRRALGMLWDRARFAEEVHRGLARPIAAPPFGHVDAPVFDRTAAAKLLDESGYLDSNGDGVRDRNGTPIRLTLLQSAGARALAIEAKAWAHELRRVGLLLDTVTIDPGVLLTRLKQGDFDIAPLLWDGLPDDDPRPLFGAQEDFNFSGHRSDSLQSVLDELRLADGPLRRAPLLQRIAEYLAREQPVVFLYRHDVPMLVSRRVHGLAAWGDRFDLRRVWVEPRP